MNSLDANFFEVHEQTVQTPSPLSRENWKKPYSPVFLYKWDSCFSELKKEKIFEYKNPLTGGPVMPTMGARLELVKESTKPVRHTGSVIYQVAAGHGWSEIGEMSGVQRFEWEEKDIFCIPSWTPYRHGAATEATLFSFNEFPAMKALRLYRESHD
jgi:gentisate 1,2-dioxygenase